jgi:hypothetical protein
MDSPGYRRLANWPALGAALFVFLAALSLRGLALDRFVTPDEPAWLGRSAAFYHALVKRDFAATFQHSHPGVTATWAGALAFRWRYPALASESEAKTVKNWQKVDLFLRQQGYHPLALLAAARFFMVLGSALALGAAAFFAARLIGVWPALLGFLFICLDPFHLGLTRLLHLDGLLGSLMVLAALAFMAYLFAGRRAIDLLVAGLAAGLALLTKTPSLFLLPFFVLAALFDLSQRWESAGSRWGASLWLAAWPVMVAGLIAIIVFIIAWPAMWVDPAGTLFQMFAQAASYAEEGHASPIFFNGQVYTGDPGWNFYPLATLWRSTPAALAGLGLALAAIACRWKPFDQPTSRQAALLLGLYAVFFGLMMSLGAKKFDRYLLPAFLPLDLLAGAGWAGLGWRLWRSTNTQIGRPAAVLILALAVSSQAFLAIQTHPYYLSYYNPLLGGSRRAAQVMMIGWGEGLDQAGRYLDARPDAQNLHVMSHYPYGSFSYFFRGEALELPERWEGLQSPEMDGVDYLVLYIHQWQRQRPDPEMLAFFAAQEPEYIVRIDGFEYARVYNLDAFVP